MFFDPIFLYKTRSNLLLQKFFSNLTLVTYLKLCFFRTQFQRYRLPTYNRQNSVCLSYFHPILKASTHFLILNNYKLVTRNCYQTLCTLSHRIHMLVYKFQCTLKDIPANLKIGSELNQSKFGTYLEEQKCKLSLQR